MEGLKNLTLSIIWNMIVAWLVIGLIVFIDNHYGILDKAFIPSIIKFIQGFGFSAKVVLFIALTIIFVILSAHEFFGVIVRYLLGGIYIVVVVAIAVAVIYYIGVFLLGLL
jgi:hypothetical protein